MYRGGSYRGYGGRSKATADTLCQKCLKKDMCTFDPSQKRTTNFHIRHYSYECTASAQERPYKPRPSRTQQLLNPQLKPKLMTDVPNELLRKKGVADELLAKKEEERGRKSSPDTLHRRSRSVSSSSVDSVSTISTNRSRSRPRSSRYREKKEKTSVRGGHLGKRGRRSVSTSDSYDSGGSLDRNTRRRMSSFSPGLRGRRRSRSGSTRMEASQDFFPKHLKGGNRAFSRSRSRSYSRGRGRPRRLLSRSRSTSRRNRRRRSATSPMDTDDHQLYQNSDRNSERLSHRKSRSRSTGCQRRGGRLPRSRSRSPFRSARNPSPCSRRMAPRSPSPYSRRVPPRSPSPLGAQNDFRGRNAPMSGRGRPWGGGRPETSTSNGPAPQGRERSLSPYSKRVAMTRAMAAGQ
ncbi:hypothetical protein CC78DRAFT_540302 [Lojkania enalia]|uniref:Uncharacterized protein n=1 Tax=Lojkania enalia TaxID=147567 RepID=A0A9P4N9V3_9PLEO|nr:hypothetical protein CC78DRAFT_540302 [Didymosphaeria enalia]